LKHLKIRRNLLRGTKGVYEVYIGEIEKPILLRTGANAEQLYKARLKTWDKADRAASQIIVKTLDAKIMMLLVMLMRKDMWFKL